MQPADVLACAGQGTGTDVGGHDAVDPPAGQDGGEYSRPRPEVECGTATRATGRRCGERCLCDEVDVFAPDRGEHAVVRVNASVEGRYLHSLRAPLMRSDHAQ
ncbi:hypothetical protein GCM10022243_02230 [Saccharothrix violaceirubra]